MRKKSLLISCHPFCLTQVPKGILGTTRGELDGTLSMCIVIVQLSPENQYSFTFEVNC